jgi:hypothetical protein
MQRSSDLTSEIQSSFGRERSAQKGYRAFWLFYRLHFSGFTVKEPRLHFSGFKIRALSATFFGVHGYVYRGSWLHLSRYTATFIGVHQSAIGYIFRGLTARLTLPSLLRLR